MTAARYGRLCLVLVLPLLLLGFLNATFLMPYDRYVMALCTPGVSTSMVSCRNVRSMDGDLYKEVKAQYKGWFDVNYAPYGIKPPFPYLASSTTFTVYGATILKTIPYAGVKPNGANAMEGLVGTHAVIKLGIENADLSVIEDGQVFLSCNSVTFLEQRGVYESDCFGRNWGGPITYSVDSPHRGMLNHLQDSLNAMLEDKKTDYFFYRVVLYPIFVYAFLVISALTWMTTKAVRFVRSG